MLKKKLMKDYIKGKITLSGAAKKAELTIFEMEKYLVEQDLKSQYLIRDLKE